MLRASLKELSRALRRDAERYAGLGGWKTNPGFWAGATYRVGHWAKRLPPIARGPALAPYKVVNAVFRLVYQVRISADAQIGPGLCLIHPSNILVGDVTIGENCLLFHEVTLGTNANSDGAFPELGDNVDVYVGARVLGKLRVGSGAKIGANVVVTSNVPEGCTVVPAPNRMVPAAAVAAFGPRKTPPPQGGPAAP
jgi:serine O-acetyltransferase